MSFILHIETSTRVCSAALSENGKIISLRETQITNSHASHLAVFIDEIIKESKVAINTIDAVSVSKGPGSYTGLRIGISTAKGLCYAIDKPLIAINTLRIFANGFMHSDLFAEIKEKNNFKKFLLCPMIDARRMEVYTSVFSGDLNEIKETQAKIIDEKSFSELLKKNKIIFFGDGAMKCKPLINHPNALFVEDFEPSATHMISLSEQKFELKDFENTAYFEPYYLKDFIATIPKNKVI